MDYSTLKNVDNSSPLLYLNESTPAIYMGYLEGWFRKYSHLKEQLQYYYQHNECDCYWPERTQEADAINNVAYTLFEDLFVTTPLQCLLEDKEAQGAFLLSKLNNWLTSDDDKKLSQHGLVLSIISGQFHFSDYYQVCQDINNFSKLNFSKSEQYIIQNKLLTILETLSSNFFQLNLNCYTSHPNEKVKQELLFIQLLAGHEELLLSKAPIHKKTKKKASRQSSKKKLLTKDVLFGENIATDLPWKTTSSEHIFICNEICPFSLPSAVLLEEGTHLNELFLHKEAIIALSNAIHLNPLSKDAYIERAAAYFETGQLSSALEDYKHAKALDVPLDCISKGLPINIFLASPSLNSVNSLFSQGLVIGIFKGSANGAAEFFPSIWSCCKAILRSLWTFVCSPIQTSTEMITATYAMGDYLSKTDSLLELAIPEIRELSSTWEQLDEFSKGMKIGGIIGKYGIEIFGPSLIIKGTKGFTHLSKWKDLNRANVMMTLECYASSETAEATILKECEKLATARGALIEAAKAGKIIIKSPNVIPHVMQHKHGWDKIIKLTGNIEEDFKKIIKLLEDNKIHLEEFRSKTIQINSKIARLEQEIKIGENRIKAIFIEYTESGELFLNDAWVVG